MPELPEVQTVVNELNKKLVSRTINAVEVFAPKLIGIGSKTLSPKRITSRTTLSKFISTLKNKKILSVTRRAKLLIFDIQGPWSLLVHLKMTGQFIFEDENLRRKTHGKYRLLNKKTAPLVLLPSKHTHVIFNFTDGAKLYYNDVRKFSFLKLVHDNELNLVKEFKEYGPEPLSKAFTFQIFKDKFRTRPKGKIKTLLMDNRLVVGIGNIYSDEILFHAQVSPTRTVSSLTDKDLERIFNNISPVLKQGIKARGSSVGDFVRTDGSWGSMGKHHFVYGRKKHPCKVCGSQINSVKIGGRTSSFCPSCQS